MLVVRLSGNYSDAGTLSLATSVTAVFSAIGSYSVRNYQISDITEKFSNCEYLLHRVIFCFLANVSLAAFLVIAGYDTKTSVVIFAYMMYRNCSILTDVFAGIAQKHWRMDISGISMIARAFLELAAFCGLLYYQKNLLLAILGMAVSAAGCMVFIDIAGVRKLCEVRVKGSIHAVRKLTVSCFPMFCHGILASIIAAIPKVCLENLYGEELLGYYTSIATPAVIVQIVASYIFSPLIPVFSDYYLKRDRRFFSLFVKIMALLFAVGIMAVIAASFLGDWALSLVFGEKILQYSYLLTSTIWFSLATAISWFIEMLLVVMRNNRYLIWGSIGGVAACIGLTALLIPRLGIDGVNLVNISAAAVQILIFCAGLAAGLWKKEG